MKRPQAKVISTERHKRTPEGILDRWGMVVLSILVAGFSVLYIGACVVKYRFFGYWDIDLAHNVQACHTLLNGSLENSLLGINFLGNHFDLILFPVATAYALFRSPLTLLVLQVLVAASAAFPLFFLARRAVNSMAGLVLTFVYLAHPALGYSLLYEFHPVVFAGAFMLWALWAFPLDRLPGYRGRFLLFVVFALLGLASRENFSFILIMLGLYAVFFVRDGRLTWSVTSLGLGLVWFVVVMLWIMPLLNRGLVGFENIYPHWGKSPGEIAFNVLRQPHKVVTFLFSTPGFPLDTSFKRSFYLHLLSPELGLSLLSPATLALCLPVWFQQMLSIRPMEHSILRHYTALILPVVMVSATMGLRNLLRLAGTGWSVTDPGRTRTLNRILCVALLLAATGSHLAYGPFGIWELGLSPRPMKPFPSSTQQLYRSHWQELVAAVPDQVPVVTSFVFQARLADRMRLYSWQHLYSGTYTMSRKEFPLPEDIQAVLIDFDDQLTMNSWRNFEAGPRIRAWLERERLRPVRSVGNTVLYRRDPEQTEPLWQSFDVMQSRPLINRTWPGFVTLLAADLPTSTVEPGKVLPLGIYWRSVRKEPAWIACSIQLHSPANNRTYTQPEPIALGYNLYLPHEWPAGKTIRQNVNLPLPADLPSGEYELRLELLVLEGKQWSGFSGRRPDGTLEPVPPVRIGTVRVGKR